MSTVPTNINDAITELQATDADENTAAAALVTAYASASSQVTSLTSQLAAAIAANNPSQVTTQLQALQTLNSQIATNSTNMKAALNAPVTPAAAAAAKAKKP